MPLIIKPLQDPSNISEEKRRSLADKMEELEARAKEFKKKPSKMAIILYNFLSLFLALANILLTVYVILRVVVKMLSSIMDGHLPPFINPLAALSLLPHTTSLGYLLECCIVIYLVVAAFVGFYTIPGMFLVTQ